MVVKKGMSYLLLCYPVLPLSSRLELFGMASLISTIQGRSNHNPASTAPPKPPRNPATGTATTGAWTGIFSPKATDGRIL